MYIYRKFFETGGSNLMKNIALVLALSILTAACGNIAGDPGPKALTVTELNILKKDKPEEFNSRYAGRRPCS
jgi:hypothetical protein